MNKEEILKKAQSSKDEREQLMIITSHRFAGKFTMIIACILALILLFWGKYGETVPMFSYMAVSYMLVSLPLLNLLTIDLYQIVTVKNKRLIPEIIFMSAALLWVVIMGIRSIIV
jgi:cation transport ATPase